MEYRYIASISLALMIVGCGSGGDSRSLSSGTSTTPAEQSLTKVSLLAVTDPPGSGGIVTNAQTIDLRGFASADVVSVSWSSSQGGEGVAQGSRSWTIQALPLALGDNLVTITGATADGGTTVTKKWITRNQSTVLSSHFQLEPRTAFVNEPQPLTFSLQVDRSSPVDPGSVRVVEVDENNRELKTIVNLNEVGGSGSYGSSATVSLEASGYHRFRVTGLSNGQPFASETREVFAATHFTPEERNAIQTVPGQALDYYNRAVTKLGSPTAARDETLEYLYSLPSVQYAGAASGNGVGIWIVFRSHALASLLLNPSGTMGGGGLPIAQKQISKRSGQASRRKTRLRAIGLGRSINESQFIPDIQAALVQAPFTSEFSFSDNAPVVLNLLAAAQPVEYATRYDFDSSVSVTSTAEYNKYGVIHISTHGGSWFDFATIPRRFRPLAYEQEGLQQEFRWFSAGKQVGFLTGESFDVQSPNFDKYEALLRSGQVGVGGIPDSNFPGDAAKAKYYYSILPSYIEQRYSANPLKDALVTLAACDSNENPSMGAAFLQSGAKTYLGYSGTVTTQFSYQTVIDFYNKLLTSKTADGDAFTTGDALTLDQFDPAYQTSTMEMEGSSQLTLEGQDKNLLKNGNFSLGLSDWLQGSRISAVSAGGINGVPDLGQGQSLLLDAPYSPVSTYQDVVLPSSGTYRLSYMGIGQYNQVEASITGVDLTDGSTLFSDVWLPPPTIASVDVQPFPTTGASWVKRVVEFPGRAEQNVRVRVHVRNTTNDINGDIGIFDDFVLVKIR